MKHFIGLDVPVKETAVCIIDEAGKICREVKVVSHPDDLIAALKGQTWNVERVGLEAGPLSQWLFEGLARASTWSRGPCKPSTTRSARGCHPCLRDALLPMSPVWTRM